MVNFVNIASQPQHSLCCFISLNQTRILSIVVITTLSSQDYFPSIAFNHIFPFTYNLLALERQLKHTYLQLYKTHFISNLEVFLHQFSFGLFLVLSLFQFVFCGLFCLVGFRFFSVFNPFLESM